MRMFLGGSGAIVGKARSSGTIATALFSKGGELTTHDVSFGVSVRCSGSWKQQ
jgi:hypothetical protein